MIDTKAIRKRIIAIALSGQLVEHNSDDETAKQLVDRLIKEYHYSKYKPEQKEAEPYSIPENWTWCKLSEIGSTNIGLTYHPEDVSGVGTIVIRSNNIQNSKIDYSDIVRVNCKIRDIQYLNNNDIVICSRNGSKALVGKCALYMGDDNEVSFGAFMAVFRSLCNRYLIYYFQSELFRRYFSNDDSKQINQVTQDILKKALVPLPPLAEQQRIVERVESIFSLLDEIDEAQKQYADNLGSLRIKLIDLALRGVFTEGQKDWERIRLDKVAKLITGGTPPTANKENFGNDYPFIKPADIDLMGHVSYKNGLSKQGAQIVGVIPAGAVLMVCVGSIGKCCVVDREACCNQQINYAIPKDNIDSCYLFYVMMSDYFQKAVWEKARGTTIMITSKGKWGSIDIPLPPLAEQKRIVDKLNELLPLCS